MEGWGWEGWERRSASGDTRIPHNKQCTQWQQTIAGVEVRWLIYSQQPDRPQHHLLDRFHVANTEWKQLFPTVYPPLRKNSRFFCWLIWMFSCQWKHVHGGRKYGNWVNLVKFVTVCVITPSTDTSPINAVTCQALGWGWRHSVHTTHRSCQYMGNVAKHAHIVHIPIVCCPDSIFILRFIADMSALSNIFMIL